jgi:integrase
MFKINRAVKTKPEIKEKIVIADSDIDTIFSNLNTKTQNFKTAIYLLFYTGLRSSEILTIETKDVDLNNLIINYYSPKAKLYRQIPFHQELAPILQSRLEKVPNGKIIKYSSVEILNRAFTRYLHRLGLDGAGYTARTFRKTFITLCRCKYNMDETIVKELVGHIHENTTDKYYNKISMNRMREELSKFCRPVVENNN